MISNHASQKGGFHPILTSDSVFFLLQIFHWQCVANSIIVYKDFKERKCVFLFLLYSDISSLEEELERVTQTLVEDFLEPEKNNLIRRLI